MRAQAHARRPRRRVDDLHLTLAFLDDQPEEPLAALHDGLGRGRRRGRPALHALAYGLGASSRLWCSTSPRSRRSWPATRSAARAAAGIDLPRERFRPHVTLARFPATAPPDPARLPRAIAGRDAPEVAPPASARRTLWSSGLTPAGPSTKRWPAIR